jgi:hypothetical protein
VPTPTQPTAGSGSEVFWGHETSHGGDEHTEHHHEESHHDESWHSNNGPSQDGHSSGGHSGGGHSGGGHSGGGHSSGGHSSGGHQHDVPSSPDSGAGDYYADLDHYGRDSQQAAPEKVDPPQDQFGQVQGVVEYQQISPASIDAVADALKTVTQPDSLSAQAENPIAGSAGSSDVPRQYEIPTQEQIAESISQLVGGDDPATASDLQTATQAQVSSPVQIQEPSTFTPTADEIADATEQLIAAAPTPAQSTGPNNSPSTFDQADPFRDAPLDSSATEDNAQGQDVLAEEPLQPLDEQQDDDLPPLG